MKISINKEEKEILLELLIAERANLITFPLNSIKETELILKKLNRLYFKIKN